MSTKAFAARPIASRRSVWFDDLAREFEQWCDIAAHHSSAALPIR
jgi:hypothetical protein